MKQGAGWQPRTDDRYSHPITKTAFYQHNTNYTKAKLQKYRVDPEWQTMLSELVKELEKGRMSGPYAAPATWSRPAVTLPGRDLQHLPDDQVCFSFCFSVRQTDKVRRCEDFTRSNHNNTMVAHDVPHHHTIEIFADLARAMAIRGSEPLIWAQDLNGAYRQFPVKNPDDCFCALLLPEGPLILRRHALMFGAASSVWSFNRAADSIMFLGRRALSLPVGHFVDDFIGVEPSNLAATGFAEFARLARILGLRMKESKALEPDASQKVLGIQLQVETDSIVLKPHANRCHKVLHNIHTALVQNRLTCEEAQQLAGKINFLSSTMFGQLGKAALQPVYARAHGSSSGPENFKPTGPLKSGLQTLRALLQDNIPSIIPTKNLQQTVVIYTDAYFTMHGTQHSVGSTSIPTQWSAKHCPTYDNGWGFVIRVNDHTWYSAGKVPAKTLRRFCSRKAFIFFLELVAQLIAFMFLRDPKMQLVISFIDNTSGLFALQKGFCRDQPICNMVALM